MKSLPGVRVETLKENSIDWDWWNTISLLYDELYRV